jgi:ketosteroid isomerase-like protein
MSYTPTEQANIDAIHAMNRAENAADWDAVYSLVTPGCITRMGATVLRGQDEMRRYDSQFFPLFSSYKRTIQDIAADGETVVFRWRADAVLASDARHISWEAVSWCRMEDGKVAEGHIYVDSAEVQRQMRPPKETGS